MRSSQSTFHSRSSAISSVIPFSSPLGQLLEMEAVFVDGPFLALQIGAFNLKHPSRNRISVPH